ASPNLVHRHSVCADIAVRLRSVCRWHGGRIGFGGAFSRADGSSAVPQERSNGDPADDWGDLQEPLRRDRQCQHGAQDRLAEQTEPPHRGHDAEASGCPWSLPHAVELGHFDWVAAGGEGATQVVHDGTVCPWRRGSIAISTTGKIITAAKAVASELTWGRNRL